MSLKVLVFGCGSSECWHWLSDSAHSHPFRDLSKHIINVFNTWYNQTARWLHYANDQPANNMIIRINNVLTSVWRDPESERDQIQETLIKCLSSTMTIFFTRPADLLDNFAEKRNDQKSVSLSSLRPQSWPCQSKIVTVFVIIGNWLLVCRGHTWKGTSTNGHRWQYSIDQMVIWWSHADYILILLKKWFLISLMLQSHKHCY